MANFWVTVPRPVGVRIVLLARRKPIPGIIFCVAVYPLVLNNRLDIHPTRLAKQTFNLLAAGGEDYVAKLSASLSE